MNVPFLIAKRYFFSRKKRNIISIISNIAMIGVAVGSAALIIVLSVFNGLEDLIREIYSSFDPDLKISALQGKSFETDTEFMNRIRRTPGVAVVSEVIEDNALLRYNDRQMVVKVKGVSENFFQQNEIDSSVVEGSSELIVDGMYRALIGRGVQYQLSIRPNNQFIPLQFLYPRNTTFNPLNPEGSFNSLNISPAGIFAIERQYDDSYVFVPLNFASELLEYGSRRTALEIKVAEGFRIEEVKRSLQQVLGEEFKVQNSDEQHTSLLRAVKVEKLFVFITFAFILGIASLNIFFSLSMLVIDKKKDIAILASMGATAATIRNIFLLEGALVALIGAAYGLTLGMLVCNLQQNFGLVSMGMSTSVVEAYPVKMEVTDFLLTGAAIIIITLLVSIRPARKAAGMSVTENV
ncbi:lipoprotein-releasing system permease protein [Pontibacter ummariensis]|uniref:Lipoprotein-releasing system permease protein n=1 Tax=Pontibacter ummariensis TaxID=1610492 RepID=A0A239CLY5_9BACT|nr:ABC transporter permease [Pontibacter ummariensis]PRY14948.1 lipoprotein-releasing system permease protein [Pontibacter ummariensis]SNS20949.1 lipoprotein-releasing system permease protein [Pontibacter ummariensis]